MKISSGAKQLYDVLQSTCWMTERKLAKMICCRASRIKIYKDELESVGLIKILFHRNGARSNPKHEIIKFQKPNGSPICKHISKSFGLSEWGNLDRSALIECYLKSGLNILPFAPCAKRLMEGLIIGEWKWWSVDRKFNFFYDRPELNIGLVVCPHLLVVDVDTKNNCWLQHENFGNTLTVSTPRGYHFYFRNDSVVTTSTKLIPDIDTLGKKHFVLLPPSKHPSGELYKWENIAMPQKLPIEFRREWQQRDFDYRRKTGNFILPQTIEEGTRNDTLWRHGRSLHANGKNYFEIEAELTALNRSNCIPPLSSKEMRVLIDNAYSRPDKTIFKKLETH